MMSSVLRWGIASASFISEDYVTAVQLLSQEEHQVVAVAARNLESAQKFANKFNIQKAYDSYEKLALDKDVDVVYIGSYHPGHLKIGTLMLNAGKPVLCEKPLGINLKQVKEFIKLARQKKVFLAEGLWSRHFPAWKQLKKELEAGIIGTVKMVTINFGVDLVSMKYHARAAEKSQGTHGALLDIGCYGIMAVNDIFHEKPEKIVSSGLLLESGADEAAFITLHYKNRRIAQVNIHAGCELNQNMIISGSKSSIEVPNFWTASQFITQEKTFEIPLPQHTSKFNLPRSEGFVYQAQAIRECIQKGKMESEDIPLSDSEMIMEIMDEIRRQIGVSYDVD